MSKVIAVVGAGGKSTLIENLADKYSAENKNVCITTTTHIYKNHDRERVFYVGNDEGEKLSYPGDEIFSRLCDIYDVVLVEADGSKHFPIKIPNDYEPVIPKNVNEIIVVMGFQAVGRAVGEVCQRFMQSPLSKGKCPKDREVLTERLIDFIAENYYINPLRKKFPDVQIEYFRNNFLSENLTGKKVALVLMASGSSKRFGSENKLFHIVNGKELFRYGLDALISAKKILKNFGIEAKIFVTGGNISEYESVKILENPGRLEGISSSIRQGTKAATENNCEAILFLAGDLPNFPADDIARLVREFLCSGKLCGCAFSNYPANPGIFSASIYDELLKLSGDTGALKIIKTNPEKTHYYVVSEKKLLDVDTLSDIINL